MKVTETESFPPSFYLAKNHPGVISFIIKKTTLKSEHTF